MSRSWVVLMFLLVGCPSKPPPPPPPPKPAPVDAPAPPPEKTQLEQMIEFTEAMCACKNKACAKAEQKKLDDWAARMAEQESKTSEPTDEEMKKLAAIGKRYGKCMAKATK